MRNLPRILFILIAAGLLVSLTGGCSAKAKKARHLQRADKYFAAGEYPKAEIEYLNVLRLDPQDGHTFSRLGTIYYDQGRFAHAYSCLTKASGLNPADLELHYKLGTIYLVMGKAKEAREKANLILEKMPAHPEAPTLLADAAANPKDAEEVRQRLQKISTQIGDTAPLRLAIGTLDWRGGDMKAAEAAFKRALELDPKSDAAHYGYGNLCWAQSNLTSADAAFKTASDLSPTRSPRRLKYAEFKIKTGDLEAGKRLLAEQTKAAADYLPALLVQAEIAFAERKFDDATALVKQVLARDSGNYEALMLRGRLMMAKGQASGAIAEFERMSGPYERAPQVHYNLALAYLLNNDAGKASKSLKQAITLAPNYDEAVVLLANLNTKRGDTAPAIAALTDVLKRRPKLPPALLGLAAAYRAKGELDSALATYSRLAELFPKNAEAPFLMGMVYVQQKNKPEARKAFAKALELAPGYFAALELMVDLDISDKQFTAAIERIQPEVEKKPNAPEFQLLLAKVYAAERKAEQAEAALLKAIELNPDLQGAYLLLAQLYVGTNQKEKALAKLNEVLVKQATNMTALMLVATIHNEAGDLSAARTAYEKLLAVNPRFYSALNNLAYLYSEKFNMPDEAYEMARKARDLFPQKAAGESSAAPGARNVEFLSAFSADTLGWIVFKRGDYPWALSLLQESAEKLSSEPEVLFHLGMTHYMLGHEEEARTTLNRALSFNKEFPGKDEAARRLANLAIDTQAATPSVLANLEKQLTDQPADPVLLARVAAVYEREGKPEKILKAYEAALKANPKNVAVMIKLARLYAERPQNSQRALELVKDAYKLAPEDGEISAMLGRLVFDAGDHKWAMSLLQQSVAKQDQSPGLLFDLALAYYSVGRVADAQATAEKALKAGPFDRANEAKQFLDLTALSSSPTQALTGESRARDVLKSNPDHVPALAVSALCSEHRGDVQAARAAWERALARYPEFTPATKHLALLYTELGSNEKAYEMAMKARKAFPDDAEVARTLGIAFYNRADYRNSSQLLSESVRKTGEDGKAMYYLGMAYYQLKQKPESKAALQRALALNVQSKLAEEAKRILTQLN